MNCKNNGWHTASCRQAGPPITFEDIVLYAEGQQGQNLNWNLTLRQLKEKETDPKFASVIIDWLAQNSTGKLV